MKKYFFIGLISLFAFGKSQAQIGVGAEVGVAPDVDFENAYVGGGLKFDYFFKTNQRISLSLGAYSGEMASWIGTQAGIIHYMYDSDIIPVNIGYQIDFGKSKIKPLLGLDVGMMFEERYFSFPEGFEDLLDDESNTFFGLGVTVGARVDLTEKLELNLTARPQYYLGDFEMPLLWVHLGVTRKF